MLYDYLFSINCIYFNALRIQVQIPFTLENDG